MSLIPSESLNFPDSFRANVGWHLDEDPEAPTSSFPAPEMGEPKSAESPKGEEHPKPAKNLNPLAGSPLPPAQSEPVTAETSRPEDDRQLDVIPPAPAATEL